MIFKKGNLSYKEICDWLLQLRVAPYVPHSNFCVTAVIRARANSDEDYYFAGVNVEIVGDHRQSTHAEEGAIAAMVTTLGKSAEIREVWVMGAPKNLKTSKEFVTCCGKCRQQIAGLSVDGALIHSVNLSGEEIHLTLEEYLPQKFTFRQFAPELLALQKASLSSKTKQARSIFQKGKKLKEEEIFQWLKELESFDLASKISQSVVIKLTDNLYVAGTKVEDAAFISINPIQSAIASAATLLAGAEIKILEVWSLSSTSALAFIPLSLASMQNLFQFAKNKEISIHLFNNQKATKTYPLKSIGEAYENSRA